MCPIAPNHLGWILAVALPLAPAFATSPAHAANDALAATTTRIGEAAPTLHSEEYRVLNAVLRHGLPADTRRLVIEAATVCDHETLTRLEQDPAAAGKLELTPELVADFATINATPVAIERRFEITPEYTLLDRRELDTLFAKDGWSGFFSKYIATPGVLRLSRVGFDPATRHALVLVEQLCGSECGAGRLVRLERGDDESWRVLDATVVWLATRADTPAQGAP